MFNIIMLILLLYMFIKSKNISTTLIVFLTILYFIEVVFVEFFFQQIFSVKANKFTTLDHVTYSIVIFVSVFYIFNANLKDNFQTDIRVLSFKKIDFFGLVFMTLLFIYLYYDRVIFNLGDYHLIANSKSSLVEYMILMCTVILYLSKCRILILGPYIALIILFFISGERLIMFSQMFVLYLIFKERLKFNFKFLLFFAFFLAMIIDFYRSVNYGSTDLDIHMSHFGELTISSMYLVDYTESLTFFDRFEYLIGIMIGNIFPSSFLPINFDIKRILISNINIPGGGWLPIWFYSLGGYVMVFFISIIISYFNLLVHNRILINNIVQDKMFIAYLIFTTSMINWYMYSPYQIFKFTIYGYILVCIMRKIKVFTWK